jgi:hypothetical protein
LSAVEPQTLHVFRYVRCMALTNIAHWPLAGHHVE